MAPQIEGNFEDDGFVIVRQLFDRSRVQRMIPILDAARETYRTLNPETGKPDGSPKSFFHVNNTKFFAVGSEELRELLEAGADEQLHAVFELAVGAPPTFSHFSCWYEPEQDEDGGGWYVPATFFPTVLRPTYASCMAASLTSLSPLLSGTVTCSTSSQPRRRRGSAYRAATATARAIAVSPESRCSVHCWMIHPT
jgi:hypothetical protein